MRLNEMFTGWYDYDKKEFDKIMNEACISFDTNILLNFYRYSKKTSEELFSALEPYKGRIVTSYYVVKEFTNNRKKVKMDNLNEYSNLNNIIKQNFTSIENELEKNDDKKINSLGDIVKQIKLCRSSVDKKIESEREAKKKYYNSGIVEENIEKIFLNNFIDKYNEKDFIKIKEEGLRRFTEQIPPGYEDAKNKDENGDYYVFKSLIDYCKKNKKDIIFVTNDNKPDWFREIDGVKEPREELLNEFNTETGRKIIIFNFDSFMKQKAFFKDSLPSETVNEIKEVNRLLSSEKSTLNQRINSSIRYINRYDSEKAIYENLPFIIRQLKRIQELSTMNNDVELLNTCDILLSLLAKKQYTDFIDTAASLKTYDVKKNKVKIVDLIMQYNFFDANRTVHGGIELLENIKNYLVCNTSPSPINRKMFDYISLVENEVKHGDMDNEKFCLEVIKIYNDFFDRFNRLGE